ncbi:4'-phosphopantetheinyl transferase family protein [Streptomyces luteolus]|uniref:4'-phosphopantetheinyl transferase superfamily protein n=1 Tax=Streptomyces luteolus TaxID=3043615 RepID=A0ABT6T5F6_9ACTN|nr:4'-phosphopantetheinyl transferase superfamily protein [Streptomyces sp. B-S-A12]MDI3422650.1 4'-phosphopantetheinyl transferase superfamily protein [Streptomyces sp. B-S-A12]
MPVAIRTPGLRSVRLGRVAAESAAALRHEHLLDPGERQRLGRFRRAADRDRYRAAHVGLRVLLGEVLGVSPEAVPFARERCAGCGGPHGRPVVPGNPVRFSLSHAGDCYLIVVSDPAVAVGVDVEAVPEPAALDGLTGALHPAEAKELRALRPEQRPAAFARCWTRKEAVLKAEGSGLHREPAGLHVGVAAEPALQHPAPAFRALRLLTVPSPDGYAASCAVMAPPQA